MPVKTHGYARRRAVPHLPATTPRVCPKCDSFFAARPRESVCDGCVPPKARTERALKTPPLAHHASPGSRVAKRPGQRGAGNAVRQVYSEALGLTFDAPVSDPRAASLECRVLAYEEAARQRWKHGKTPEPPDRVMELAA
jgi:hypothetical protein